MDNEKQYCSTCKWFATVGVCCNGDSEHVADFRNPDDICDEWEKELRKEEGEELFEMK